MRSVLSWVVSLVGVGLTLLSGYLIIGAAVMMAQDDDYLHIGGGLIALGIFIAIIGVPTLLGGISLWRHRADSDSLPASGRVGWNCPHCGRVQLSGNWQCAACGTPRPTEA